MIKISFNREYFILHAEGHAGFGIKGQDPVCAGASALIMTLASVAENFDRNRLTGRPSEIRIEDGTADIRIYPKKRYANICLIKMDTVMEGLYLIAKSYPENLSVEG